MGDRLWVGKPSWYITSHLDQLSCPSLWGRQIEYQPSLAEVKAGCIGLSQAACVIPYGKRHPVVLRWIYIRTLSLVYVACFQWTAMP